MESLPQNIFELEFIPKALIELLKNQLNKDFSKVGDYAFEGQIDEPKIWISLLSQTLVKLSDHELNQLLYVIDLPENWSKNLRSTENSNDLLAEAILKREWQKIIFKIKFM